jgi:hypothetical protein
MLSRRKFLKAGVGFGAISFIPYNFTNKDSLTVNGDLNIKIIGIGKEGVETINRLTDNSLKGVKYGVVGLDDILLDESNAHLKIKISKQYFEQFTDIYLIKNGFDSQGIEESKRIIHAVESFMEDTDFFIIVNGTERINKLTHLLVLPTAFAVGADKGIVINYNFTSQSSGFDTSPNFIEVSFIDTSRQKVSDDRRDEIIYDTIADILDLINANGISSVSIQSITNILKSFEIQSFLQVNIMERAKINNTDLIKYDIRDCLLIKANGVDSFEYRYRLKSRDI